MRRLLGKDVFLFLFSVIFILGFLFVSGGKFFGGDDMLANGFIGNTCLIRCRIEHYLAPLESGVFFPLLPEDGDGDEDGGVLLIGKDGRFLKGGDGWYISNSFFKHSVNP